MRKLVAQLPNLEILLILIIIIQPDKLCIGVKEKLVKPDLPGVV